MSRIVSLNELAAIPIPEATNTYKPVGHMELIEKLTTVSDSHFTGSRVDTFRVNNTGSQLFGTVTYNNDDFKDHTITLGFRNSYDKSLAVGLCAGQQVIVCSNLMFTGDIVTVRKHTQNVMIDLENLIVDLVMSADSIQENADYDIEKLKSVEITNNDAAQYLGEAFINEEVLTPTQLSVAKREWFNSVTFPERTAWSLYNSCTEALKKSHTSNALNKYSDLHKFSMKFFDFN